MNTTKPKLGEYIYFHLQYNFWAFWCFLCTQNDLVILVKTIYTGRGSYKSQRNTLALFIVQCSTPPPLPEGYIAICSIDEIAAIVAFYFCFKTSPGAQPFIWKWVLRARSLSCESNSFPHGFAPRLVLKQRQKATRKWPIVALCKRPTLYLLTAYFSSFCSALLSQLSKWRHVHQTKHLHVLPRILWLLLSARCRWVLSEYDAQLINY